MIISHSREFIFLKPRKVAGTSVEVALSRHTLEGDVVTPMGEFDARWDEDQYTHPGRHWPGLRRHATLREIRKYVGDEVWRCYFTFSIVRNPWDLVVSKYHWATRPGSPNLPLGQSLVRFLRRPRKVSRNFSRLGRTLIPKLVDTEKIPFPVFAKYMLRYYEMNDGFYFNGDGTLGLDHVLRYENLTEDFGRVCERLGIPDTPLPFLKTKTRPKGTHYSEYYDDESRERVARVHRRQIEAFGYTFEGPA
jgi:hypothetical protein